MTKVYANENNIELDDLLDFSQTVRVLYIEDNDILRKDTFGVLHLFFGKIDMASDGIGGLKYFKKNKYDLIITGVNMPNMNGLEMITKIREISKHITILIISEDTEHFVDFIKLGIDGYILKPVIVEQFVNTFTRVIEKLQNKQELFEYKNNLEKKVESEIAKRIAGEKILMQQSKLAAMGEMMDAVAHQWKQPINIINMQVNMVGYDFEDGLINQDYIDKFQNNVARQVNHMTTTLDEFRSFFRPNKEMEPFYVQHSINSVLLLIKDEFIKNRIEIEVEIDDNFIIDGIENEFKHVILNILNNAKDAFVENKTKERNIILKTKSDTKNNYLLIQDNAGGIPLNIINNIFKANVTSKEEGKGTGIGLYMSKQIVEKYNGTIKIENIDDGATFTITL